MQSFRASVYTTLAAGPVWLGSFERSLHRRSHSSTRTETFAAYGVACQKPQSELRGHSAASAQHNSSLKSGRRAMLRRLVSVVGLLAASSGGFIGSRPAPTRASPRFAEKRKPGQRGSARAKERLRKALEKEGAPPPRELREVTPAPAPVATTTTIPSRVELRRRAGLPPIEPMLRRAPADLTEKSVAARGSAKSTSESRRWRAAHDRSRAGVRAERPRHSHEMAESSRLRKTEQVARAHGRRGL